MYYEEKTIREVLYYRTTPNGRWRLFTKEQLTQRIKRLEEQIYNMRLINP